MAAGAVVREAVLGGLGALFCLSAAALALQHAAGLDARFAVISAAAQAVLLAASLPGLAAHHPHRHFGAANHVTLLRGSLLALLAAALLTGAGPHWWMVAVAIIAALLDALDGPLARRLGTASAYGARFDMEVDAAFILLLALLVWQAERAPAWVLLAGLLRYLFVAAGRVWPWLRAPLPPSVRRQAVCVAQIVILIACLLPPFTAAVSVPLAAAGLALLSWSFARDVRYLRQQVRSSARRGAVRPDSG